VLARRLRRSLLQATTTCRRVQAQRHPCSPGREDRRMAWCCRCLRAGRRSLTAGQHDTSMMVTRRERLLPPSISAGHTKRRTAEGGRALTTGNYTPEVQRRLLAAWVVRLGRAAPSRTGRAPYLPGRRSVGPTLTNRGEARTTAQFINSTHLLVPSPVQRRSAWAPRKLLDRLMTALQSAPTSEKATPTTRETTTSAVV